MVLKPHVDTKSIVLGMDIFPTLLELSTDQKVAGVDGKSYAQVLKGKETWGDRTVFWISKKARPHSTGDSKAAVVRSGDYKLIQFLETKAIELYNLKEDVGEENNLAEKEPAKTAQLLQLLKDWKKEYLVPEKTKIYKPKDKGKTNKKSKK